MKITMLFINIQLACIQPTGWVRINCLTRAVDPVKLTRIRIQPLRNQRFESNPPGSGSRSDLSSTYINLSWNIKNIKVDIIIYSFILYFNFVCLPLYLFLCVCFAAFLFVCYYVFLFFCYFVFLFVSVLWAVCPCLYFD